MEEKLEKIKNNGIEKLENAKTVEELQNIAKELTGKKSELGEVLKSISTLSNEEKKVVGMKTTEIKQLFGDKIKQKEDELISAKSVVDKPLDLTLPGTAISKGALHPITQMCYDLNEAFLSLGFEVYSEDDISSEKYAFDNLNFPADHPARQSMDTFWLDGTEEKLGNERLCLRPHLTGGSVRYLLKHGAPARFVYPGRVYRNENTDARHERAFFQYEALIVDKNISFSSGMVMIQTILEKVFGRKINVRMREGFFPFTEPGYEIDMLKSQDKIIYDFKVFGGRYAYLKDEIFSNDNMVFEMHYTMIDDWKKIKPDIKTIYILPTDLEVPKQKARQRNLSKEKEIERIKEIDEQYNKFMNDKDFQGKFDYILYNNYDSESEKQILDLVKNLIVNE